MARWQYQLVAAFLMWHLAITGVRGEEASPRQSGDVAATKKARGDLKSAKRRFFDKMQRLRWIAYTPSTFDPKSKKPLLRADIEADLRALKSAGFTGLAEALGFGLAFVFGEEGGAPFLGAPFLAAAFFAAAFFAAAFFAFSSNAFFALASRSIAACAALKAPMSVRLSPGRVACVTRR